MTNKEISLTKLKSKENTVRKIMLFFIVVIVVMTATGAYLTVRRGFGSFTVLPAIFIAILFSYATILRDIRKKISEKNN
jgi:uncharacterized oligopeptide transporter (OPT) family protein